MVYTGVAVGCERVAVGRRGRDRDGGIWTDRVGIVRNEVGGIVVDIHGVAGALAPTTGKETMKMGLDTLESVLKGFDIFLVRWLVCCRVNALGSELFAVPARDLTIALYLFVAAIDAGCRDTNAFGWLLGRYSVEIRTRLVCRCGCGIVRKVGPFVVLGRDKKRDKKGGELASKSNR